MERLQNPMLWQATAYSLMLGFIAAIVAVCVAYSVALAARHFLLSKAIYSPCISSEYSRLSTYFSDFFAFGWALFLLSK